MQSIEMTETYGIDGAYYKYRFVGSGAQFRVYAIYTHDGRLTGRVVKVPLDFAETKRAVLEPLRRLDVHDSEDHLDELVDKRAHDIMKFKYDVPRLIQGVVGEDKALQRQLGNLRMLQVPIPATQLPTKSYFLPTLFTQDYVMTLDDYFHQFRMASNHYVSTLDIQTIRQLKKVIDQVISLNFSIWEYGIFEFVFKPENFGIRFSASGDPELIWIDLAEHITDEKEAEAILLERRWHHATMTHKVDYQFMPAILQEYYTEECDRALTLENFHKYWRRKAIRIEKARGRKLRAKELLSRDKAVGYWVARHTLSQTLYQGFAPETIDDLQIPIGDIESLMSDRNYIDIVKSASIEEETERQMAKENYKGKIVFPLIIPPLSREGDKL